MIEAVEAMGLFSVGGIVGFVAGIWFMAALYGHRDDDGPYHGGMN